MTIRYQCTECESVLKIRDDKAGQTAHCPKCTTKFVIPEPVDPESEPATPESEPATPEPEPATPEPEPAAPEPEPAAPESEPAAPESEPAENETEAAPVADGDIGDTEDDAMAFLMESGDVPIAPPSEATALDDDEDDPPPPPPRLSPEERPLHRPPTRKKAETEDTSSAAGALLAASESARSAAANESESVEERPRIDMTEVKQLAIHKLLPIVGGIAVISGIFFYLFSSMSSGAELPPLASVSGTITLDGKPLPDATVLFEPVIDETIAEQRQIGASVGRSNQQGVYTLAYPGGHDGAVMGAHTVRINKTDVKGLETLAKKYHLRSQLKHEVKAGSNTIDLPLRSEPAGAAKGKRTADPPTL